MDNPIPANENDRLKALQSYQILDTLPEEQFDRLTKLASLICETPITLISMIDTDRQWFKSNIGLEGVTETPRDISFCQHAIMGENLFEVEDATKDARFKDNVLVTGNPDIRFYAGQPIIDTNGYALGTLCVIDRKAHKLNDNQKKLMAVLAKEIAFIFEAQQKNREREKFEAIFNMSPDLICIAGVDGFFKKINPAIVDILGYKQSELLEKPFFDYIHPDDIAPTIQEIEKLSTGQKTLSFPNRYLKKDGTYILINWAVTPDTSTGEMYAIGRDITDADLIQRKLNNELEAINNSVLRVELSMDFDVVNANGNFCNLLGYDENELKKLRHSQLLFVEDSQSTIYADFLKTLKQGISQQGEFKRRAKDGTERWIKGSYIPVKNKKGVVERIIKIAYDITNEKIVEADLYKSNRFQDAILNSTDYAIISTDKDGVITQFNSGAEKMLGYTKEEIVNKTSPAIFHDLNEVVERAKILSNELNTTIEPGFNVFVAKAKQGLTDVNEWTYIRKDGAKLTIELSVTGLQNELHEYVGFLGVAQNITKRKLAEEQLNEYLNLIESKNKELDQFSYIVSHDLKAPLRAINNLAEWIVDDLGEVPDDVAKNIATLRGRVHRMEDMINGILEYSKIGRKKLPIEAIDINLLVNQVIESLAVPTLFKINIQNNLPIIKAENILMYQIFSNLISNAIKYNDKEKGIIDISYEEDKVNYIFAIKDNGLGILPEYFDKVFGMFQTIEARDTKESTGIGLSLVKKIIDEKGGKIWIESDGKTGSTFKFSFPK